MRSRALESTIDRLEPSEPELALMLEAELASHAQQASVGTRAPAARRLERHGELAGARAASGSCWPAAPTSAPGPASRRPRRPRYLEDALADGGLLRDLQLDIAGPFYDVVVGLLATESLDVAEAAVEKALAEARARGVDPGGGLRHGPARVGRAAQGRGRPGGVRRAHGARAADVAPTSRSASRSRSAS